MVIHAGFLNGKAERLEGGFEFSKSKEGFGLETHAPLYHECVYNSGIMSVPIQFSSQEAFEDAVCKVLRDKLSFSVSTNTDSVDISHGQYVEMKTHKIEVQLDGETITEFTLD